MHMPQLTLKLCAAALVVVGAGALVGGSIGATPMLTSREAAYPSTPPASAMIGKYNPVHEQQPPDHYPLVTPRGTISVAELSLHGRLRNQAQPWWDEPDQLAVGSPDADQLSDEEIARLAEWNAPISRGPDPLRQPTGQERRAGSASSYPAESHASEELAKAARPYILPSRPRGASQRNVRLPVGASSALPLESPAELQVVVPAS
jgi:hypothetical protein